jgi:hypothetical protein
LAGAADELAVALGAPDDIDERFTDDQHIRIHVTSLAHRTRRARPSSAGDAADPAFREGTYTEDPLAPTRRGRRGARTEPYGTTTESSAPAMTSPPVPRYAGLDGLRALAVVLVVVYHLFPGWVLHSGFVGVDVFFVISGFLITSLLLREHDRTGRIALLAFWTRRARRLLPALAVVVTVSASAAWLVGGDVLLGLGRQVLGAITFSSNWASLSAGASYFAGTQPELLRNLWSLAVEEQFYVLWPPLLPVFLLLRAAACAPRSLWSWPRRP